MEQCERCLEDFYEDDMFMGLCDDCFKTMYGHDRTCEPFPKKKRYDDERLDKMGYNRNRG